MYKINTNEEYFLEVKNPKTGEMTTSSTRLVDGGRIRFDYPNFSITLAPRPKNLILNPFKSSTLLGDSSFAANLGKFNWLYLKLFGKKLLLAYLEVNFLNSSLFVKFSSATANSFASFAFSNDDTSIPGISFFTPAIISSFTCL